MAKCNQLTPLPFKELTSRPTHTYTVHTNSISTISYE